MRSARFWADVLIKHPLTYIILAAFLIRLYFIINPGIVWWDSAVYIGIGKYIFSVGAIGVEEWFRPLLLPIILGSVWKMGIDPYIFGMFFDLILNIAAIYLTYLIAKKVLNKDSAIFASILVAFTTTFIFYSSKILSENLTIVLMLVSIYLLLSKKYYWAGLIAGISIFARYPQALILPAFVFYVFLFEESKLKEKLINSFKTTIFFLIPVAVLFIFNYFAFGNFLYQLTEARIAIQNAGNLIPADWNFYFIAITAECFFAILFFYSLYLTWKEKNKSMCLIHIIFIIFFIYYSTVLRKEIRYLMVVLPMLYISIGNVFDNFWHRRIFGKKHVYKAMMVLLILIFASFSYINIIKMQSLYNRPQLPDVMDNFYRSNLIDGKTVISSSPNPIAYSDLKVIVMEPTVYYSYLNMSSEYFMIYDCDLYCGTDSDCASDRKTFLTILNNTKQIIYEKHINFCAYLLYKNV